MKKCPWKTWFGCVWSWASRNWLLSSPRMNNPAIYIHTYSQINRVLTASCISIDQNRPILTCTFSFSPGVQPNNNGAHYILFAIAHMSAEHWCELYLVCMAQWMYCYMLDYVTITSNEFLEINAIFQRPWRRDDRCGHSLAETYLIDSLSTTWFR